MGNKGKRTGEQNGMTNSQMNFMIAKAMRSGTFEKARALAENGASKGDVKLALVSHYSSSIRPNRANGSNDSDSLSFHLDKLADQIIFRYGPKDKLSLEDESEEPRA